MDADREGAGQGFHFTREGFWAYPLPPSPPRAGRVGLRSTVCTVCSGSRGLLVLRPTAKMPLWLFSYGNTPSPVHPSVPLSGSGSAAVIRPWR